MWEVASQLHNHVVASFMAVHSADTGSKREKKEAQKKVLRATGRARGPGRRCGWEALFQRDRAMHQV